MYINNAVIKPISRIAILNMINYRTRNMHDRTGYMHGTSEHTHDRIKTRFMVDSINTKRINRFYDKGLT